MFRFIEQILDGFRPCFSRRAAFRWFVVVIVGLMLRSDRLGVTSIIRDLALDPSGYESLIHFFRSTAWDAGKIRDKWYRILVSKAPLLRIHGRVVLIGDGVKQSKEGYFIPGVKKMVQESEDSSKPQYIFGHMFGAVGVLAGTLERHFCLPLKINIQEGLRSASLWDNSGISPESHIIQMIESAFETADVFGRSILLLDRYFLTTSALRKQAELNAAYGSPDHVTIVTKAKSNYVAYRKPAPKAPGAKGRPRLKGDTVKLSELLNDDSFNIDAFGSISIIDATKTAGTMIGWMKAYPDKLASGYINGSTYVDNSFSYKTAGDPTSGVKNMQFWGLTVMTNKGSEADYTCNGTKVSFRLGNPVRCVRND